MNKTPLLIRKYKTFELEDKTVAGNIEIVSAAILIKLRNVQADEKTFDNAKREIAIANIVTLKNKWYLE